MTNESFEPARPGVDYRPLPPGKRIVLQPGEHRAVRGPAVLTTLLGSCVAACLYDSTSGIAGMNHFLLANRRYARNLPLSQTEAGRYGIHAMELLITDMQKLGASRARLRAKIFGGSSIAMACSEQQFLCVGEVNQRFIREYLALEGIPIDAEDLGGQLGRVIFFHSDSHKVYRRYIKKESTLKITREEELEWKRSIDKRPAGEGEAILF